MERVVVDEAAEQHEEVHYIETNDVRGHEIWEATVVHDEDEHELLRVEVDIVQ